MSQKRSKFNTEIKTITNDNIRQRLFYIIFSLFILLIASYLYFVSNTIFNIIERKTAENDIRTLTSQTAELELEYFSLSNKINLELAKQLGFYEPTNISFAVRKALVTASN